MSQNLTLLTDLYQLTMAQGYWEEGLTDTQACFYAFYRDNPFKGGYAVSCGADQVAELIKTFKFDEDDIAYLASLEAPRGGKMFREDFLEWLAQMELDVDVDVVPDGTIVFPREPLVRVTGPILQCQILETCILNGINFQTLIATKAARICSAAKGRAVAEFGLRRAQGPDGGLSASRAAYVGGVASVANVLAGQVYGIPVSGTHAHSWVMTFDDELEAFRAYARTQPNNCVLLVDTYDVKKGIQNAITVGLEMKERGEHLSAIRIDSGDLAWLSQKARKMLDDAGLQDTGIVLSNDLDEYIIEDLLDQGASFTSLGVGTRLATAYDQAALGGVYKLSAIKHPGSDEWIPKVKVSEATVKVTVPGVLDTMRFYDADGHFTGDVIFDVNRGIPENPTAVDPMDGTHRKHFNNELRHETLLQPLARNGKVLDVDLSAQTARSRCQEQLQCLDKTVERFMNPHRYPAGLELSVYNDRNDMLLELRGIKE